MDSRRTSWQAIRLLILMFLSWKAVLLVIVAFSPGLGYDTSTSLLLSSEQDDVHYSKTDSNMAFVKYAHHFIGKLIRWDALYFVKISQRGHLHEQEWAFSWAFTRLVKSLSLLFSGNATIISIATTASVISHIAHLLSTILIYTLCRLLHSSQEDNNSAFITAGLHIVAPAGIFLSAPYTESSYSALSILGYYLYAQGLKERQKKHDLAIITSGLVFGIASMFRSNGVLNGVMFAFDLVEILRTSDGRIPYRHGCALLAGGALIAAGFAIPQIVAYTEYCSAVEDLNPARPWCGSLPPSIYTFVQAHYWNNGFLRYWTLSNVPLFLLAAPMLTLLWTSALATLRSEATVSNEKIETEREDAKIDTSCTDLADFRRACLIRFALPQLMLATLALTNFHVQIITRLASGYVLPYVWLAGAVEGRRQVKILGVTLNIGRCAIQWMVMYGTVQAGLYASFLPPA